MGLFWYDESRDENWDAVIVTKFYTKAIKPIP